MDSEYVFFKSLKKYNKVILKNPCTHIERFASGKNKGDVKAKNQIQYNTAYDTIDLVEQRKIDPKVTPTSVVLDLRKGVAKFHKDEVALIKFLDACEQNEANGGTIFKKIDVATEQLYELQSFERYDKAVSLMNEASDNDLRAAAGWLFKNPIAIRKSPATIKLDLRRKLNDEDFAKKVIEFFEDKSNEEKLTLTIALHENIIEIKDGRKIGWMGQTEAFFSSTQAADVLKDCALWLKNDEEGRDYAKLIAEQIKKSKD